MYTDPRQDLITFERNEWIQDAKDYIAELDPSAMLFLNADLKDDFEEPRRLNQLEEQIMRKIAITTEQNRLYLNTTSVTRLNRNHSNL